MKGKITSFSRHLQFILAIQHYLNSFSSFHLCPRYPYQQLCIRVPAESPIFMKCFTSQFICKKTYRVAENMSSNFFFSVDGSCNGQFASSWCTNITFSRTALDTPIRAGISLSISAHRQLRQTFCHSETFIFMRMIFSILLASKDFVINNPHHSSN